jgi:putative endonuclease
VRAALRLRAALLRASPRLFARIFTPDSRELGRLGEECAVRALLARGFVILGRRVRTPFAEVDVVAADGRDLVCVEVKTARFEPVWIPKGSGLALRPARFREHGRLAYVQTQRLLRAARWMSAGRDLRPRIDLVEVALNARTGALEVEHRPGIADPWETRSRFGGRGPRERT